MSSNEWVERCPWTDGMQGGAGKQGEGGYMGLPCVRQELPSLVDM